MKVVFVCSWNASPLDLSLKMSKTTIHNGGIWNKLSVTANIDEADVVVILEGCTEKVLLQILGSSKKIIGFSREPTSDNKMWMKYPQIIDCSYKNHHHTFTYPEFLGKNYDYLKALPLPKKSNKLSIIMSSKDFGHLDYAARIKFVKELIKRYPNDVDLYGFGWNAKEMGPAYKGQLSNYHGHISNPEHTKFHALEGYEYTICIENTSKKNYFTEKLTDAYLCYSFPIYYGCTNINEYFDEDTYMKIDIHDFNSIERIMDRIKEAPNYTKLTAMRERVLEKYNIWPSIERIIQSKEE